MEEDASNSAMAQHQKMLRQQQQQLLLLHQFHQRQQPPNPNPNQPQPKPFQIQPQHLQHLQNLQQQQQAMSRFPSNIDAHLRPRAPLRFLPQQQPPPQQKPAVAPQRTSAGVGVSRPGSHVEVEMAQQDAWKVCNPDVKTPFASLEDAVHRLLPYHVVADFEAEEDDRIIESDTTGQVPSRLQQWDHTILAKLGEFTSTFEKQVLAFNIMSRKRALGEFRSEERLMIEQALLQEEKQTLMHLRAEMESREKAEREAAEANMRLAMVQAEQARANAHSEMLTRAPLRGAEVTGHEMGQDQGGGNTEEMNHGWGSNSQREEEEPSDDYLNDENEPGNEDNGLHGEWRGSGDLDLNSR